MTRTLHRSKNETTRMTRQEKLAAITAVLGEGVAERLLKEAGVEPSATPEPQGAPPDPDRLAWQKNRLIKRLRSYREEAPQPKAAQAQPPTSPQPRPTPQAQPQPQPQEQAPAQATKKAPRNLKDALEDLESLSGEHPVVIAHILKSETQAKRVTILRSLPGPVARAVMQRLRAGDREADDP